MVSQAKQSAPVMKDFDQAMAAAPEQMGDVSMDSENHTMKKSPLALPIVLVALLLGVGSGYLLFTKSGDLMPSSTTSLTSEDTMQQTASAIQVGKTYGSKDSSTFSDSAEGVVLVGGVNGEGSHHIVRDGGESQNVYLTSSEVDLNQFVGAKVLVKGQTFKAQRAGWLMDVGQVKVEELNAQLPDWAQKAAEAAEAKASGNE